MRNLVLFFSIFAALAFTVKPTEVKASHAGGGEIIYQWLSDSTYRFIFKFYRDCGGIQEPDPSIPFCGRQSCDPSLNFNLPMPKWQSTITGGVANGSPVSPGCSDQTFPDECDSPPGSLPGYKEWWYSIILPLPIKCTDWTFSVSVSARNSSNNIPGSDLYVETTFDNKRFQGNSSPYFSIKPVPYVCYGVPYTFNNGAIDPDGDSIATDIVNSLGGGTCGPKNSLAFNGGFNPPLGLPSNPFQTNNSYTTNSKSGQMRFTPWDAGPQTITTRVREFRNGRQIGYIMRDVQVQVITGCNPPTPTVNTPPSIPQIDGAVNGCINQKLEFCFDLKTTKKGSVLVAEDNRKDAIPMAVTTYANNRSDSIHGCFTWTPTSIDTGLKGFIVTVKDSTCEPPGIMIYFNLAVPIYIWGPTRALGATSICPKTIANLSASGGGNYQWDVLPGGATIGSLNCISCMSPEATPLLTTQYVVTSTINSFCPALNKDTVQVEVYPAPVFSPLPKGLLTCPNTALQLNLKPTPAPGQIYTYKWKNYPAGTPAITLDNDSIATPTLIATDDVAYEVVVGMTTSICKLLDTVNIEILDGFRIDMSADTAICAGEDVQVRAYGDSRYNYNWTWNSNVIDNTVLSSTAVIDPLIHQNTIGKGIYTVAAKYAGCNDSVATITIDLQPIPKVAVDDDAKVCMGDTMQLHGIVIPADYPYELQWTPSAALDRPNVKGPIFSGTSNGPQTLKLIARSSANCSDSDEVELTVFPADFLSLPKDTSICPTDTLQLHLTAVAPQTFRWSPDINISSTAGMDPMVWPVATQVYSVYGVDVNGCADTATTKIVVKPAAMFDLPDSVKIYPGQAYQMNPMGNVSYYSWFPQVGLNKGDISNPIAKPQVNTRYFVKGTTEFGCSMSKYIDVMVMPDTYLDLPNAFIPGSVENKLLRPIKLGDAVMKRFAVYNRWGKLMFETKDINEGWDGNYNGEPQPLGVYMYTLEATTPAGKTFIKNGNVTLIR